MISSLIVVKGLIKSNEILIVTVEHLNCTRDIVYLTKKKNKKLPASS